MKQLDRRGEFPAVKSQPLSGRVGAGGQAKVEVRVAPEYIDCWNILSGSNAEKKESCQSEVDKFLHVSYCASRECKKNGTTD
jgi:hypothetical protein